MKISFHGAARTVTGSKHLLHLDSGKQILLDCGMFQGMGKDTMPLNNNWGFDPRAITSVIISHAHIDHIGLLPKLVKDGYKGSIYCTPATAELAELLLLDSARIQEADIGYVNKQRAKDRQPPFKPLYDEADARKVFPLFKIVDYGNHFTIDQETELMYTDGGHIIGSAAVNLKIREQGKTISVAFSGDVGRYEDMILRAPEKFPQADHVIMESTYGDKLHETPTTANNRLLQQLVHTCIEKKGKLIMPAFSLGRTQEILYMFNRLEVENRLPPMKYYVDGMLSISITKVVKQFPDDFNDQVKELLRRDQDVFSFKGLEYIEEVEDSKRLNGSQEPCVIISASGMAEAGRVKHHIANNISDPKNTIMLTGYCDPNSLGGRLKQHPRSVHIFGKNLDVQAEVDEINSLSAHGDYEDLINWLDCQDKSRLTNLFLVHGEYEVQQNFRERLLKKGVRSVTIPTQHQTVQL